jgi:hypothetical protein
MRTTQLRELIIKESVGVMDYQRVTVVEIKKFKKNVFDVCMEYGFPYIKQLFIILGIHIDTEMKKRIKQTKREILKKNAVSKDS